MKKAIIVFIKIISILMIVASFLASTVTAIITVIPDGSASKASMLGYKTVCSFAPISTFILGFMAILFGIATVGLYRRGFFSNISL